MRAIALALVIGLSGIEAAIRKSPGFDSLPKGQQFIWGLLMVWFTMCLICGW